MEVEGARRKYAALHEDAPFHDGTFTDWAAKRDDWHPYHFMDGVTIFATPEDLNPDARWLTDVSPGLAPIFEPEGGDS